MLTSSSHEATPIDAEMPEVADKIVPIRRRIDAGHVALPAEEAAALDAAASNSIVPLSEDDLQPCGGAIDPSQLNSLLLELDEPLPEMLAAAAGQTDASYREHMQLQVAQLASHLRERLRDVDRREGQLNARVAELEADLRSSKLWLRDREMAFQERERELVGHIADLQGRIAEGLHGEQFDARQRQFAEWEQELAAQQQDLQRREVELAAREQKHALLERDLAARSQELAERLQQRVAGESQLDQQRESLAREVACLREIQHTWDARQAEQERELSAERQRLGREAEQAARREADLQAAEAELARHVREWQRDESALAADRQAWTEQRTRQRQALEERQRQAEAELADRRQRLDARQEWIEEQKTGLEQVRGEVLALHRQSLEMRLLAEQLWAQITGRLTPSEVTHAIAQLKLKLSEQYRLEEQSLEARKRELLALAERIRTQHDELSQLRTGLRDWAAARQAEIEGHAASLVEREIALEEQHEQLRQARAAWHAERWQSAG